MTIHNSSDEQEKAEESAFSSKRVLKKKGKETKKEVIET